MRNVFQSVIHPVYQPIVDQRDNSVLYFEALMRVYNDATDTLHQDLLRIGEVTGMIRFIDFEILRQVLAEIEKSLVVVGANVSVASIEMAGQELLGLIEKHPRAAHSLVVEITETLPIARRDIVFEFVSQARALGCSIALDDFGAGHFTITDIEELRPDYVKLDGSLVNSLIVKGNRAALADMLESSVQSGYSLVAEKIDSPRKQSFMADCGVRFLQGYYVGRPTLVIQSESSPGFNGNPTKMSGIPAVPAPTRVTSSLLQGIYISPADTPLSGSSAGLVG